MNKFKLTKDHRKIVNAAAKTDERPLLHCVHIRKGLIEAANGYVLVRKEIDYDGEPLLLNADDLNELKDIDKESLEPHIDCEVKDNSIEVKGKGDIKYILPVRSLGAEYPKLDDKFPNTEPVLKIALGKERLKELFNALNSLDDEGETVKFTFYGEKAPVLIENNKTRALLMPMCIQW